MMIIRRHNSCVRRPCQSFHRTTTTTTTSTTTTISTRPSLFITTQSFYSTNNSSSQNDPHTTITTTTTTTTAAAAATTLHQHHEPSSSSSLLPPRIQFSQPIPNTKHMLLNHYRNGRLVECLDIMNMLNSSMMTMEEQEQHEHKSSNKNRPYKSVQFEQMGTFLVDEILLKIMENENAVFNRGLYWKMFAFAERNQLFQWNLRVVRAFLLHSRCLSFTVVVDNEEPSDAEKISFDGAVVGDANGDDGNEMRRVVNYIVDQWNTRLTVKRTRNPAILFPVILDCLNRRLFDRAAYFYDLCLKKQREQNRMTKTEESNGSNANSTDLFSAFHYSFMISTLLKIIGQEQKHGLKHHDREKASLLEKERLQLAQKWIHDSHVFRVQYSSKEYMHILSACVSANLLNDAMNILNRLIDDNAEISAAIYGLLLETLRKNLSQNIKQYKPYIHRIITHLKKTKLTDASERLHQAAISVLAAVDDVRGTRLYIENMFEVYGQKPTIRMVNYILGAKCRTREFQQARKFVLGIKEQYGVLPDVYTFNILLDRATSFPELHLVLGDMSIHRVSMDRVSYNTLIKGLCNSNMQKKALFFYSQMKDTLGRDFTPDLVTMITLIRTFKDDPETVYKLYNDIINYKIPLKDELPQLLVLHCAEYRETLASAILSERKRFLHAQPLLAIQTLIDVCRQSMSVKQIEALKMKLREMSIILN